MVISDQTPLLPRTRQESASRRRWRECSRRGAFLMVVCVCMGLIMGVSRWSTNSEKSENSKEINPHIKEIKGFSAANNESLNYLVVGDWGRQGLYNQSQVAIQMGRIGQQLGIQFVISVGDNFYDTGLTGEDDPAFTTSFTNVYTAPSLQTTWYTVLGNHDYMGDVLAQLSDELVRYDPRWFCRRSFQLNRTLCGGSNEGTCNASVDMFFFDTTPFIDEYWSSSTSRTFDWRGLAPRDVQLQSQLEDLAKSLNASSATWKIVVGHHTIRSIGHHGDLSELVEQLLPILEEYEVDLYINGHDHNLQHIKRADSSVHFITSGAGSKAYSGLQSYTEEQGVQFAYDGQGFLAVSMKPESISLTFHDVFGDAIYNYILQH
eukprot:c18697_g1_i1 orf=489-1616(-)